MFLWVQDESLPCHNCRRHWNTIFSWIIWVRYIIPTSLSAYIASGGIQDNRRRHSMIQPQPPYRWRCMHFNSRNYRGLEQDTEMEPKRFFPCACFDVNSDPYPWCNRTLFQWGLWAWKYERKPCRWSGSELIWYYSEARYTAKCHHCSDEAASSGFWGGQ